MAERLNRVIRLIEQGGVAFGPFAQAGSIPDAVWIASTSYAAVNSVSTSQTSSRMVLST